ncbi:MAG: NHL repeat-containing protein [Verrucomicrobiae bacterium]|nr:NHL repeat-containing protein [Verrucomicrobiae bacterium]
MKKPFLLFAAISLLLSESSFAGLKTHQAADLVLGQPDFETELPNLSQTGMTRPRDVAIDPTTGKVFVADSFNHRILRFASHLSLWNGTPAEAVFGQDDFVSQNGNQARQNRFDLLARLYIDHEGRLWVTDQNNHRVLRYENASHRVTGTPADGVLGQPDFTSFATGLDDSSMNIPIGITGSPDGTIWVADLENHRVLRFDNAALKINGAPADAVLGQLDFLSKTSGTSATKMKSPTGIFFDDDGALWVAERDNNRILRFDNAASLGNGAAANGVLGQDDFSTASGGLGEFKLQDPSDVVVDSQGTLYVSDYRNFRVLGFLDAAKLADGSAASIVLGQTDFGSGEVSLTAQGAYYVQGLALDELDRLYVSQTNFNRVLRYSPDGTPAISIKGKKSTRSSNLTLRGTAFSDLLVTSVQVKGKRGGFKNARGTSSWTYRLRGLGFGTTKAKVKATSLDGKTAIKTVRVRRR